MNLEYREGFKKVSEKLIHNEDWFSFVSAEFEGPQGEIIDRYIFHHPGAVAVVPIEDRNIVLVRQFRPALEMEMLEIPAGKLDVEGEEPEAAARRELIEEAGLDAERLEELCSFHNSAGFSDEKTVIYLATEMKKVEKIAASIEEQYMTTEKVPLENVHELITSGRITDAKTIIGIYSALQRIGE
ncbi:MAG: ADP-ribose pyrophosphatase [Actinobacteria bacterium]|nr:ADP-ribose pyrophosphatase [Actinomycetota bacterium]MED5277185.1 NUDIX hydrolase [Actinomycetota bacterium]|tara:strand:- start:12349 stop:12903 length:555 start_codon:yes stop_codon:yes gene_type:complete